MPDMTKEKAREMADYLKRNFPWLGTNREADGANTVDELSCLYHNLREFAKGRVIAGLH